MQMPVDLQAALNEQLGVVHHEEIANAAQNISLRYRTRKDLGGKHFIQNQTEALAYAVARMPATFGAVYSALGCALDSIGMQREKLTSLIDVGAGTGAAAWAANEWFDLDSVVCLEQEDAMKKLGQAMMLRGDGSLKNAQWQNLNIATDLIGCRADLVIASYVINELEESLQLKIAEKLWSITNKVLLFVEAGTPEGYHILDRIRTRLLAEDAHILAPCPHENTCPITEQDWCHFACRVQRSRLHKLAKKGEAP